MDIATWTLVLINASTVVLALKLVDGHISSNTLAVGVPCSGIAVLAGLVGIFSPFDGPHVASWILSFACPFVWVEIWEIRTGTPAFSL